MPEEELQEPQTPPEETEDVAENDESDVEVVSSEAEGEDENVSDEEADEDIHEQYENDEDTEFYRIRQRARRVIEEAWPEEEKPKSVEIPSVFDTPEPVASNVHESPYARRAEQTEVKHKPVLERSKPAELGKPNTIIPKREETLDPDDFFAVKGQLLPEYNEAAEEKPRRRKNGKSKDVFEDEPKQTFVARHMRGIVTLMLLALTALIVLIWSNTSGAQLMLASVDIAWKPEAYAQLAEDAYAVKDLSAAGYYFTKALERDPENYNYAIMAANSYIEGGYTTKAMQAVRTCIDMDPDDAELYVMLLNLQPDIEDMSAADKELIRQGYRLTRDDRLKID